MPFDNLPRTNWDLNFPFLGVPVRVHPYFWLTSLFMGSNGNPPGWVILMWIGVVFVSVLVHEMGHALAIRSFGWRPQVLLYSFGGLALYHPTHHDPRKQIAIALAGPAAGFLLAGLVVLVMQLNHHPVLFFIGGTHGINWVYEPFVNLKLTILVEQLLYVNIFWGLMNLLPVLPLDGGQVFREVLVLAGVPRAPIRAAMVSFVLAIALALFAILKLHETYIGILFGLLAFNNYRTLEAYHGRGGGFF